MAMGLCSVYSSLQVDLKSSLQPGLRVGDHMALTDFRPDDPKWTLAYGWCRTDSTISIVLGISIL